MYKGVARVTEALAEFQHFNCMIVRIFGKSREFHAMLGLKLLLRQLPPPLV